MSSKSSASPEKDKIGPLPPVAEPEAVIVKVGTRKGMAPKYHQHTYIIRAPPFIFLLLLS
jgi:hypothetical protein